MELKPIRSKKVYQRAFAEIERLRDAPAKSPATDRLDVLTLEMIRRLADGLQLPGDVLINPYRLRREAGKLEAEQLNEQLKQLKGSETFDPLRFGASNFHESVNRRPACADS